MSTDQASGLILLAHKPRPHASANRHKLMNFIGVFGARDYAITIRANNSSSVETQTAEALQQKPLAETKNKEAKETASRQKSGGS
ncbi:MAG TPA: hypothetical protein PLD20_02610 [Blastocatellia bacterium]|nr:hypothetical protein [Blastocatellia bacterium]HMV84107.1 hypothetical protein [Blastocatellia bacterium]HMX29604.1 hypothetical protein [Blastocatellia bacterium]HMZ16829.1 hypothetical protein [Blastocatellia bacterium]HNG29170.1 hypothetical protein [Blastocatellia bacterium]